MVPLYWPSFTYCRKFSTVFGAFSGYSSRVIAPMLVFSSTCGLAAMAAVLTANAASNAKSFFMVFYWRLGKLRCYVKPVGGPRRELRPASGAAFGQNPPAAFFMQPVLALLHLVIQIAARVILVK